MFKKFKEWLSVFIIKNPSRAILIAILLLNILLFVLAGAVISALSPASLRHDGFWASLYYTISMVLDAGCIVSTPTCGPCLGGHMGCLAAGERCVSTTNRNFVGRMGHVDSEVYLASPAVAAASGIAGHIAHPEEV